MTYIAFAGLGWTLSGLAEVALDLRWSWSHASDPLWERIDPDLWNLTSNPWLILGCLGSKPALPPLGR